MRPVRGAGLALILALSLPAAAAASGMHAAAAPAGPARASRRLQLVLPLVTDTHGLTRFADAVSTPGSPLYGHYASVAWLARRFGARPGVRRRVVAYLRAHGASDVSVDASGQLVDAQMDVAAAERAFGVTLAPRRGPRDSRYLAPAATVRVPRPLRGLIGGVVGLDTAPIAADTLPESSGYAGPDPGATPSGCAAGIAQGGFTPNEYLSAYQYAPLQQQGLLGQGERVALIEIDGFRPADLQTFASCFGYTLPPIRRTAVGVSGPLPAGGEATLDIEVLDAVAPRLRSIDVYETGSLAADVLRALAQPLQRARFKPQVISISLGLCESEALQSVGRAGIAAVETVLKVAAAAGVSVLGASGDTGSADCRQTGASPPAPLPALAVNFPSSSPWVTSVGGTNFNLGPQNQIVSQTVWNDAGVLPGSAGGGGLSQLFPRPSWQSAVVASPWRAQPDVAMLADVSPGYAVYCSAQQNCEGRGWLSFGGTSAATPLLAGGFALVDELLRHQDRNSLGLANPLLYRLGNDATTAPQVFYDVTTGSNDIGPFIQADQQPLGCCTAQPGYDQASGWGGVNLNGLAQSALVAQRPLANIGIRLPGGQHPVRSRGVYLRLACSATCQAAGYARLSARGMRSFTDYVVTRLVRPGWHRLKVVFSAGQTAALRRALRARRRIVARILGAVVDPAGNIERHTRTLTLRVSG